MLDLADVPRPVVRALPFTTWFRLARVIEGSQTVAVLVAAEHLARSSGGATIAMQETAADTSPATRRDATRDRAGRDARALERTIGSRAPAAGIGHQAARGRGKELTGMSLLYACLRSPAAS